MPATPAPKGKKKYGPLTAVGWIVTGGATVLVYVLYRRYEANKAASASTATTGGTTIPAGTTTAGSTALPSFSSFGAWEQAMLSAMAGPNYNEASALNDVTSWINGSCVTSQGFTSISNALGTVGLPPGFGSSLPSLSVCNSSGTGGSGGGSSGGTGSSTPAPTPTPSAPAAPAAAPTPPAPSAPIEPNLPASIVAAMTNNGEHIVDSTFDSATSTWLYLTQKGGIYTLNPQGVAGGTFYGSYIGLPAAHGPGPNGLPAASRTFSKIIANPDGTYTATDTWGESYTFNSATLAQEQKAA